MKKHLFVLAVLAFLLSIGIGGYALRYRKITGKAATCTGSSSCNACKNCKYCQHCSKNGGSCGICK